MHKGCKTLLQEGGDRVDSLVFPSESALSFQVYKKGRDLVSAVEGARIKEQHKEKTVSPTLFIFNVS